MNADFESATITAIIDSKDIRSVVKQKVTADFFFSPIAKSAFLFLLQWFQNPNYGDTPSWESFTDSFEGFEPVRVEESVVALCDKLRERKLYSDIASVLENVGTTTAGDVTEGFELLKKQVVALSTAHTVDNVSTVKGSIQELKDEYLAMKAGTTGLKGHPYPWEALNNATLGLQNQLVFIYGRPKTKKTWVLLEMARVLHAHGLRPLIFSQELEDIEIKRRFVALSTCVDYNLYMRGQLPDDVEGEFLDNLDAFEEQEDVLVDTLTSRVDSLETELIAKIGEYRPNVILIDGMQTLSTDWKEFAQLMMTLNRIKKNQKIPIIGSTHANRSRGKKGDQQDGADDFAYGDAFYQYCTGVDTLVLDGFLNWVPAWSLKAGASVVGFDEEPTGELRQWRPTRVVSARIEKRLTYRLTMESGTTLITTPEHRSLVSDRFGVSWQTSEEIARRIERGSQVHLARFTKPWTHQRDYDTGFLAAAFDGEGFLRDPIQCVGMAQRPNSFLDDVTSALTNKGFAYSLYKHGSGDVLNLHVRGGASDLFRFMGEIRPSRLLGQFQERFPAAGAGVRARWKDRVVTIEPAGLREVMVMSTESKTFVAEGYGAHNCDLALRVTVDIENRRKQEAVIFTSAMRSGQPTLFSIHTQLASNMGQKALIRMDNPEDEDVDGAADTDNLDGEDDARED